MSSVQASVSKPTVERKPREPLGVRLSRFGRAIRSWASSAWVSEIETKSSHVVYPHLFLVEEPVQSILHIGGVHKQYVGCELSWYANSGFRKIVSGIVKSDTMGELYRSFKYVVISQAEIEKFKADVQAEAASRADIREFLEGYPDFLKLDEIRGKKR